MNRRNAVIGFLTLQVGKRLARRQMKRVGGKLTSWRSIGREPGSARQ